MPIAIPRAAGKGITRSNGRDPIRGLATDGAGLQSHSRRDFKGQGYFGRLADLTPPRDLTPLGIVVILANRPGARVGF